MKRASVDTFGKFIKLLKKGSYMPSMICKKLKCDKRTTDKLINVAKEINLIEIESLNQYRRIKLNKNYRKILDGKNE